MIRYFRPARSRPRACTAAGASGVMASQLITDFGRTASLERSAKLRKASRKSRTSTNTRAQVLIEVEQAYYQALAAESVLKVAQATLDIRRLTLRQVRRWRKALCDRRWT